jgi:hypothetical protein
MVEASLLLLVNIEQQLNLDSTFQVKIIEDYSELTVPKIQEPKICKDSEAP